MHAIFKICFSALVLFNFTYYAAGQDLDYLPPVLSISAVKDTGTSLLLNTLDFTRDERQKEIKPYTYSIQVVDAAEPWPPRWYTAKTVYTDEMFAHDMAQHSRHFNFIENPEINGNYIFYLQIYPLNLVFDTTKTFDVQHSAFFAVLDTQFNLVDSIICGRLKGGNYSAGFKKDTNIEILTILRKDTTINWRHVSGNVNDSAVESEFGILRVLDTKGNLKYTWSPIEHLDPALFRAGEKLSQLPPSSPHGQLREIRWLKMSSINWDYDGDILYGIEDVGIGKISRKDGHVLWQLNYRDVPVEAGTDTLQCYSPYDFKLLFNGKEAAIYSFYERSSAGPPGARGVVFEVNKKTGKLKLVKYVWPKEKYSSSGHGGFDYDLSNGNFVLDYGVYTHPDSITSGFWNAFEYGNRDSTYSIYQIPKWNYPFGVHRLQNFSKPPRPVIKKEGDFLIVKGPGKNYTWYKLSGLKNTNIQKAGTGPAIKPAVGATYCVAAPYGCGYVVSHPFDTSVKK